MKKKEERKEKDENVDLSGTESKISEIYQGAIEKSHKVVDPPLLLNTLIEASAINPTTTSASMPETAGNSGTPCGSFTC